MTRLLMLLVALSLAGCAANYRHQALAASALERDMYECERDAAPVQERARNRQMIERCLRVKGWKQDGYEWPTFLSVSGAKKSN